MPPTFIPKTFIRTYWNINKPRPQSNYIPNFDYFDTIEKRNYLTQVFDIKKVNSMSDNEVVIRFRFEIKKITKDLEQDVRSIS